MSIVSIRKAVGEGYLIAFDTNILFDMWASDRRGSAPPIDLKIIPAAQRSVPSIVEWEFCRGSVPGRGSVPVQEIDERRRWIRDTFLARLRLHVKVDDALRAMMERRIDIALPDALIAATCIARRAALLTLNTKHFLGFQELRLIDLAPS